jgi:hypothetical protein
MILEKTEGQDLRKNCFVSYLPYEIRIEDMGVE